MGITIECFVVVNLKFQAKHCNIEKISMPALYIIP